MAVEIQNPFIVSADVYGLMHEWARENRLRLPSKAFFDEQSRLIRDVLAKVTGAPIVVLPEQELRDGVRSLLAESGRQVVSLDRAYVPDDTPRLRGYLDMTRGHTPRFESIGYVPRSGFDPIPVQLERIKRATTGPIDLVDDVIFHGSNIVEVAQQLGAIGRPVRRVVAAVAVTDGMRAIEAAGIEVKAVKQYDQVYDEVCERDFFAGVPHSGRTIVGPHGQIVSAPYFRPFGQPEIWASIPEDQVALFSEACVRLSETLWERVARVNQITVLGKNLPRRVQGLEGRRPVPAQLRERLHLINHD